MKTYVRRFTFKFALIVSLGLLPLGAARAQPFSVMHTFTATSGVNSTNADGAKPAGGLLLSGNLLYGAATSGGTIGLGTTFTITTDGTGFTNVFNGNSSVIAPSSALVRSGNTLYGSSVTGGPLHKGNVFKVNTDGTGGASVYIFTNSSPAQPSAELVLAGDTLFGTTYQGGTGASTRGTVFAVNTNGTGFTNLHRFTSGSTNSDGNFPYSGVILSGSTLYGAASLGGASGSGAIFAMNTNSTGFTNLHSFTAVGSGTNSDGANPRAGLLLSGNRLYGAAAYGGDAGNGTVFALNTDGTGFTILHSFSALLDPGITAGTNSDGAYPFAGLVLYGNTLYGATAGGGSSGSGALFGINTDGTGFTNLHSFATPDVGSTLTNSDGIVPNGRLVLSGHTLYGTTRDGGDFGNGTLFSYLLPPPPPSLSIASVGNQLVIFWPASATNYILQSTTNLVLSNWTAATDAVPVIAVTVTNTSPGRFFRLQQQP